MKTDLGAPVHQGCHLYVVDSDGDTRDAMASYLRQQDLHITTLDTTQDLLQRLRHQTPDLVILDAGPPRLDSLDGLETCRRLRAEGHPVPLILVSHASDEIDRVLGLEMGADDYLGKPVAMRELLARVRAVLRRTQSRAVSAPARAQDEGVRIGEYLYQASSRCLLRGAELRILNTVEHALLAELTAHPNQPVTRERLREVSHADPAAVLLRAVDAAVMRLRKTVEPDPAIPRYIQTVRGLGYVFVPQGE